jgi:hypothetical protein
MVSRVNSESGDSAAIFRLFLASLMNPSAGSTSTNRDAVLGTRLVENVPDGDDRQEPERFTGDEPGDDGHDDRQSA